MIISTRFRLVYMSVLKFDAQKFWMFEKNFKNLNQGPERTGANFDVLQIFKCVYRTFLFSLKRSCKYMYKKETWKNTDL